MIETTILIKDLSKTPQELQAMSYTERVQHEIGILYGNRFSVGGIVVKASEQAVDRLRVTHPEAYIYLADQVMRSLESRGIRASAVEPAAESMLSLVQAQIDIPPQRENDSVTV